MDKVIWHRMADPLDDGVERWAMVPGFNDNYAVSTHGRVMRATKGRGTQPGRLLRAAPDGYGYVMVQLSYGKNKRRKIRIHRLVALVFLPHNDNSDWCDVHHENHDKRDNHASNLSWEDSEDHRADAWNEYLTHGGKEDGLQYGRGLA
jgi:hypothetical protein